MTQDQIDHLSAEEYSYYLAHGEEFCNDSVSLPLDFMYASGCTRFLNDNDYDYYLDGGQDSWNFTLDQVMSQIMTSGLLNEHCISTSVC